MLRQCLASGISTTRICTATHACQLMQYYARLDEAIPRTGTDTAGRSYPGGRSYRGRRDKASSPYRNRSVTRFSYRKGRVVIWRPSPAVLPVLFSAFATQSLTVLVWSYSSNRDGSAAVMIIRRRRRLTSGTARGNRVVVGRKHSSMRGVSPCIHARHKTCAWPRSMTRLMLDKQCETNFDAWCVQR